MKQNKPLCLRLNGHNTSANVCLSCVYVGTFGRAGSLAQAHTHIIFAINSIITQLYEPNAYTVKRASAVLCSFR